MDYFCTGMALGASGCAIYMGYVKHVNNWEMEQVGWVGNRFRMLTNTYRGKDTPADIEEFLKKARRDIRAAKKKALTEGVLIPKKNRMRLFKVWDTMQGYFAQDDPKDTYRTMMDAYEKLRAKRLPPEKADQYVPDIGELRN
ncbi:MAG: hypothetical protein QXD77_01300 [Candidatus Aenigmatarchaeota archaeon]